jgi:hypothetical protein
MRGSPEGQVTGGLSVIRALSPALTTCDCAGSTPTPAKRTTALSVVFMISVTFVLGLFISAPLHAIVVAEFAA